MLRIVERPLDQLERLGMLAAGICLAIIMVIVTADALCRYLLNSPLIWAFEITSIYLLTGAIFFALSSTFKFGAHISIDFLTQLMSPNVFRIAAAICDAAILPVLAIMIYTSAQEMVVAYTQNRFIPGVIRWPAWPTNALAVFGVSLLLVRVVVHLVQNLVDAYSNKPGDPTATPKEDLL